MPFRHPAASVSPWSLTLRVEGPRTASPGLPSLQRGAPQAGARSPVPQRRASALGQGIRDRFVYAEGERRDSGRSLGPSVSLASGACSPRGKAEAAEDSTRERSLPPGPGRRSGVCGLRAPPRGPWALQRSSAPGSPHTREAACPHTPGVTSHAGHPVSVPQVKMKVKVKVMPGAGAHFRPLNPRPCQPGTRCPPQIFWHSLVGSVSPLFEMGGSGAPHSPRLRNILRRRSDI